MDAQAREQDFYRKKHAAEDAVQKLCTPIYGIDDKSQPFVVGSGTILDVGEQSYLITAAHVLDENNVTTLYLPGNPLVTMTGPSIKTQAPLGNRKHDTIDLAIVQLDRSIVAQLVNVGRITPQQLDPHDSPRPLTSYGFVGYPSSKNRPKPGRKLRLTSYIMGVLPLAPERYADVGAHPLLHFAGSFNRSEVMSRERKRAQAPDPEGMSGGGVWRLGTYADISSGQAEAALIAVGIEHHADQQLLLGVRIPFVIASLRESFPETIQLLPQLPHHLEINVISQ